MSPCLQKGLCRCDYIEDHELIRVSQCNHRVLNGGGGREEERFEDTTLLPLRMKEPWAKGCEQLPEVGEGEESDSSSLQKGVHRCQRLEFSPMRPTLDFWPPGPRGNMCVLF